MRAIAEQIAVRAIGAHITVDDEIAARAAETLRWSTSIPHSKVQVKVENGVVTLTGSVDWYYQKTAADWALQNLLGVRALVNLFEISPGLQPQDLRERIEDALRRAAKLEAKAITVAVHDRQGTLSGKVRSLAERDAVERAACAAPSMSSVVDRITVGA